MQHTISAANGVYLVDGSADVFSVVAGDTYEWLIFPTHPLRIVPARPFGVLGAACAVTWLTGGLVQTGGHSYFTGSSTLTFPNDASCYPLDLFCAFHGDMASTGRVWGLAEPAE